MLTVDKAKEMVRNAVEEQQPSKIEAVSILDRGQKTAGDTYSLSEVSRYLKVSENRIRNWESSYSQLLSNHRNQYNHRVFTDSDVYALERIKLLQDSGLYTKQGIVARIKSKIKDEGGATSGEKEYRGKLLMALNTLAAEIRGLRREVREDLQGNMRRELEHLTLLLFPTKQSKRWWEFWK